jgi:three-Cys-motif partner protein
MARDLHRKTFNEATLTKLELFQNHLVAWLSVFVGSGKFAGKSIRVFDLFCGPGKDSEGRKGSPILILESVKTFAQQIRQGRHSVDIYFNDSEAEKVDDLKQNIEQAHLGSGPYTLHFNNKDFFEVFRLLYPQMHGSANLLLLDQHGFRFFSPAVFSQIRKLPFTDTLVFMSSSYVMRFKEQPEINQYLETHKIFVDTTPYHHVHRAILEYYRTLVGADEQYFLAPFSFQSGSNIYGVIFGTGNQLGLHKFLETAWRMDKLTGEANYDIDQEDIREREPSLFPNMDKPKKTTLFERQFETEVLAGHLTDTGTVYDYVLQQGFLMKHANPVLRRLKTAGQIDGNISKIEYSSLKSPEAIKVLRK